MKKLLTIAIICVFSVSSQAQHSDSTCTLTGDIRGLGNHRIMLSYFPTDTTYHADTVRAHHGHFVFTRHLTEPTDYNIQTLREHPGKMNRRTGYTLPHIGRNGRIYGTMSEALLENRNMTWKASLNTFGKANIANAPLNDTLNYIKKTIADVYRNDQVWRTFNRKIPYNTFSDRLPLKKVIVRDSLIAAQRQRQEDTVAYFILNHPHSYASAYVLWRLRRSSHNVKESAYNALDPSFHHLANVSSFRKKMDRTTANISRGDAAPDLSLADTSGNTVALSSLRGRITLVDFWASWCGPCRKENPHVAAVYKKYHKKGLEIYGVSLDGDKKNWVAAIQKDKLAWTHVSDLHGWDSSAAQAFGVQGIPDNFLLDKDGKVIAKNLKGKALEAMLGQVLR